MTEIIYDSSLQADDITLRAPYYNAIVPSTVRFVHEHISVSVDSLGHIAFFDADQHSLGAVDVPVHKDPSAYGHTAQYGEMKLRCENNVITVTLPVYYWTDSYPHCDGESDRWSRYVDRWFRIVFDCATHQIDILDRN